jgi:hypothetical protein
VPIQSWGDNEKMNVYTVKCKSTNCYLIKSSDGYLLFDAGWVNEYGNFQDNLI